VIEVRPAQPADYAALGELTAATYLAERLADEGYAATLRDVEGRAGSSTVLVATDDGRVVGGITAVTRGGPFAEGQEPGTAVLRMLVTDPAARGRGVGQALVAAALGLAREDGCREVRLSTQPMMTAAHRLYERAGFVRTPETDWYPMPDLLLWTYRLPLVFCGHCGEPGLHDACLRQLELDPPRYCGRCRRRMVVQVHPTGWSARCVEHGTLTSC
jgi:ribosomal protein S18 acetylase RimI-like enzyme